MAQSMNRKGKEVGAARALPPSHPHVQEVLDTDSRPVPATLRQQSAVFLGDEDIDVSRYTSREFHDAEMKHMWSRVWQAACREEDIPEPGDHILYEIGSEQLIVVRTETGDVRAFPNACLHRGTTLRTCDGHVDQFRCPFHGFTWSLSGELTVKPAAWDFPHITKENFSLPAVRVGRWGGFVFICLSNETESLESYLGKLPAHFTRWPLEQRYKSVHVAKVIRCNWKAAQDAFLEGYHIPAVHPQTNAYSGDAQAQYDVWPDEQHMSRVIAWYGANATKEGGLGAQQKIAEAMLQDMPILAKSGAVRVPEGQTARATLAQRFREVLGKSTGVDLQAATDAEMLDSIQYFLFPNLVPWSGVGAPLVYRFRPYKNDPNACIMEIMYLFVRPAGSPSKRAPPIRWLADGEPFSAAKELGGLGPVFDQDLGNLERVQIGLRATHKTGISLANYQEVRIRQYHQVIDEYLSKGMTGTAAARSKP